MGLVPGNQSVRRRDAAGQDLHVRDRPDVEQAELLIDIGKTTYGVAFHPQFAENGYFYVTYVLEPDKTEAEGSRVVAVQGQARAIRPVADPASEKVILEWPSGGHNGGCLRFGPDGYLYIATGDGSGIADELQTGQDIGDLLGSILRIDVDHAEAGNAPYAIPSRQSVRRTATAPAAEIWAYGHRQVWKFSFDRQRSGSGPARSARTCGRWSISIERGGNYGWSVKRGSIPSAPNGRSGPGDIRDADRRASAQRLPLDHRRLRLSTADRLPELNGAYIYGDYDTGRIWALRYDGRQGRPSIANWPTRSSASSTSPRTRRARSTSSISSAAGCIASSPRRRRRPTTEPFPRKLSETGLFASTKDHAPAPGLIPYSVNAPLWSDGAEKERFLALPGDTQIEFDAVVYPHGPDVPRPAGGSPTAPCS